LLQEEKMKQDQLIRNVIIGGAFLMLLMSGVIYNRYRLKQKSNQLLEAQQKVLQAQQKEIHEKNAYLSQLLQDKEWLLKEIHHRVKNNLQIVMSLLDSQADFLQDGKALAAIQESQQRVYAISLIHQKLYQSENLAMIEMDTYISEVVSYICESFDVQGRIQFYISVAPLKLDVAIAIPLGLLINEAITNSLKYAFPEARTGQVSINLYQIDPERYMLTIADDGIGLGKDFDIHATPSLGMTLMKGLSQQLGGNLKVEGDAGLKVSLLFHPSIPTKSSTNPLKFT
jgi:two-component sensor histidine kinase